MVVKYKSHFYIGRSIMKKNAFIRKIVSAVLCMLIVIMAVPTVANAGETAASSEQDWTGYTPISTPEELNNIR